MSTVDLTNTNPGVNMATYNAADIATTGTNVPTMVLPGAGDYEQLSKATRAHADQIIGTKQETGMLGGYKFNPADVRFASQNPYEKIYILLRAHIVVNFGWAIRAAFWMVLPLVFIAILDLVGFNIKSIPVISQLTPLMISEIEIVIGLVYYSVLLTYIIIRIIDWYYDLYIVTNERVMDYGFEPLVSYDITESRLEDIETVKERSAGVFANIFGFGDISIQTAAESLVINFLSVPRPTYVRNVIADLSGFARRLFRHPK